MNNFGFLVETIDPLPSKKTSSFGKPKGRIPYMSKKDVLSNFGKNEKKAKSNFGKKKKGKPSKKKTKKVTTKKVTKKKKTPAQRKALLRKVMKTKKDKKVTLKKAWAIVKAKN